MFFPLTVPHAQSTVFIIIWTSYFLYVALLLIACTIYLIVPISIKDFSSFSSLFAFSSLLFYL